MGTFGKILIGAALAIGACASIPFQAKAAGVTFGIPWVSGGFTVVLTKTVTPNPTPPPPTITTTTVTLVAFVDPPPTFTQLDLTFDFNPSLLSFIGAGTLCNVGTGGDCPAVSTLTGLVSPIPSISTLTLGSQLPGSTLTLTTTSDSVTVKYDLNGATSPPSAGTDENVFGLAFSPVVPIADFGNKVTIETTPGNYSLTLASETCKVSTPANCTIPASNAVYGYNLTVPEPSTWALLAMGFAGLAFAGSRMRAKDVCPPVPA